MDFFGFLKSVNSNFTLAVHSPKLGQAKTHFLSHFGEKKEKTWLDLRLLTGELKLHGPSEHHHTKTTTGTYAKLFNNVDFRIDLASFCILLSDSQSVFTT